jgi:hypothetical protein
MRTGRRRAALARPDADHRDRNASGKGFEVWIADQSDTRASYGGQLLIYDGASLNGEHAWALFR